MTTYKNIPINDVIENGAKELASFKEIQAPEWGPFVKTGPHKQRPPVRDDWWHVRAAAILQSIDSKGPIGVSKLRTKYGGKKDRGLRPEKQMKASGNIIRKILQQLEEAGLVKKEEKDVYKGRSITPKGISLLAKAAKQNE
ncbi:MAG: 30S ribosomal protein S19e [Candidatus Woesearchaeota archaeon]